MPVKKTNLLRNKYLDVAESKFSAKIKKADIFYQDIEILFENGKPKLQTHCGVILGLFMIFILASYGYMKGNIMLNYMDNTIQEPSKANYFAPDYEYTAADGWRVAFAVTAYDSSSDPRKFDDSFGTVGAYLKIWGEKDEEGNFKPTYFKKLETEPCKKSDINIDGNDNVDSYKFYEPAPEYLPDSKRFYDQLQCLKNDDAVLMGDYNASAAKMLVIKFDICRDEEGTNIYERKCKKESDIKKWLNRKFLLIMENHVVFQPETVTD